MKYYIIAGEASGDMHASALMRALKLLDDKAEFRCWGGDLMKKEGGIIVKHYLDLAFMGFAEVLMHLRAILDNIAFCKKDITGFKPDAVILIDYPGFNLRIAEFAHRKGYKVFYYISPQVWAWKASRITLIRKVVDRMFVILPFEKDFYAKRGYDVTFTGHPLLDMISARRIGTAAGVSFREKYRLDDRPVVALLPGSRIQEISRMLPLMAGVQKEFPDCRFVVAAAPGVNTGIYKKILHNGDIKIVEGVTYDLLENASAALVTSGTATLETALFGVPQVVCYKGNVLSYMLARVLVKVKYISLVNLIMNREVVKELIQADLNHENLCIELRAVLSAGAAREEMLRAYRELAARLGGPGASARTASEIYKLMTS